MGNQENKLAQARKTPNRKVIGLFRKRIGARSQSETLEEKRESYTAVVWGERKKI